MSDNENSTYSDPDVMSNTIDDPINPYLIVHIHNKSDTYHLTRQVLLDSTLTKNNYCFFYHILSMNPESFNKMYGLFACLISRDDIEADLYLNVDCNALAFVISYIQSGRTEFNNSENLEKYTDLASVFGMSELVSSLREHKSNVETGKNEDQIKSKVTMVINLLKFVIIIYLTTNSNYDYDTALELMDEHIKNNNESIRNKVHDFVINYWK